MSNAVLKKKRRASFQRVSNETANVSSEVSEDIAVVMLKEVVFRG